MFVHGKYFYGHEISEYGQEHGYVDYLTLSKAFDNVRNNDIITATNGVIGYWEQESGMVDNSEEIEELQEQLDELADKQLELEDFMEVAKEEIIESIKKQLEELDIQMNEIQSQIDELEEEQDYPKEIFQYYIVSDNGAEILKECGEIVFYNEELDMYVWGVTMYGTSWDYVLTDIRCNVPYEEETEE